MHVEDIKHAISIQDSATIRSAFFALATEKRVAGLAATNGVALLQAVAAALKDDDSIMPRRHVRFLASREDRPKALVRRLLKQIASCGSEYFAAAPRR